MDLTITGAPMFTPRTILGLVLCISLSFLLAAPAFAGGATLKAKVVGTDGQVETPLEYVKVHITPVAPLKGKKGAPAPDLVGVQITNPTGRFTIAELSSPAEGREYPLMNNWRYAVKIDAAGYWLFEAEIEVSKKAGDLEFVLKSKDYTVQDTTGVISEAMTVQQSGIVRKP